MFPARTPTLPPATHTNSYALGEREVILVEPATPYEDERRAWAEWARAIDGSGRSIKAIVVTHHHGDHVGGASFFARELGLPVWAHEATALRLPGVAVERYLHEGDVVTLDGPTPQAWKALHTPGHAPGHICLLEEASGVVVVGDMVASVGTIVIDPREGDMAAYLAELARLAGLGAKLALPAHGDPIDEPEALFRRYIAHRQMREAKVMSAVALGTVVGPAPIEALVPFAYSDTPKELWPIARLSLEAHLIKLLREGRVKRDGDAWALVS